MSEASKTKQQWEMLASEGHVLLARVDAYRLKFKFALLMLIVPFVLAAATFYLTPSISKGIGDVAGWVVGKVSSAVTAKPIDRSEAVFVNPIAPSFPPGLSINPNSVVVPRLVEDVAPAMKAQVAAMVKGERMTDCDFGKKITDVWTDGQDMTPKCRYSKDFTRLWVWSVVLEDGRLKPFAGLVFKRNGEVSFQNVEIPRGAQIAGESSLRPGNIPRTVGADFPELL